MGRWLGSVKDYRPQTPPPQRSCGQPPWGPCISSTKAAENLQSEKLDLGQAKSSESSHWDWNSTQVKWSQASRYLQLESNYSYSYSNQIFMEAEVQIWNKSPAARGSLGFRHVGGPVKVSAKDAVEGKHCFRQHRCCSSATSSYPGKAKRPSGPALKLGLGQSWNLDLELGT